VINNPGYITEKKSEMIADLAEQTTRTLQGLSFDEQKAFLIGLIGAVRISTAEEVRAFYEQVHTYIPDATLPAGTVMPGSKRNEYRFGTARPEEPK
jgi:hypothetical protein